VRLAATVEGLQHFRLSTIGDQFDAGKKSWKGIPGPSVIIRSKEHDDQFPRIIGTAKTGTVEQCDSNLYQLTVKLELSPDTEIDGHLRPVVGCQWGEVIVTRTDYDLVDKAEAEKSQDDKSEVPALKTVKQIEYQEGEPEPNPIHEEAAKLSEQEPKEEHKAETPALVVVEREQKRTE